MTDLITHNPSEKMICVSVCTIHQLYDLLISQGEQLVKFNHWTLFSLFLFSDMSVSIFWNIFIISKTWKKNRGITKVTAALPLLHLSSKSFNVDHTFFIFDWIVLKLGHNNAVDKTFTCGGSCLSTWSLMLVLNIYLQLGQLSYKQSRVEEALAFYLQDLKVTRSEVGTNHPHTATILNEIALVYDDMNDVIAGKLYEAALSVILDTYGRKYVGTAIVRFVNF